MTKKKKRGEHSQRTTYLPAATAAKTSCYTVDGSVKTDKLRESGVKMTWQRRTSMKRGMIKEYGRTYMSHFTSKVDVRFDAFKHRTARARTDRDRLHLTRHLRSSDVDLRVYD